MKILIPLILMAGYIKIISEDKAKKMFFHQYLVKPFDQNILGKVIREVLGV